MKNTSLIASLLTVMFFIGCSSDDDTGTETPIAGESSEALILIEGTNESGAYFLNQEGEEVYNFNLDDALGNDGNLLDDGSLVAMIKSGNSNITFGGFGGGMIKRNVDGSIEWEIDYATNEYICHHDVEYLPNGNILFLVWELVDNAEAVEAGFSSTVDIFPETIIEMNPLTQEIVWEWNMMDHLVQDNDNTKSNFGVVVDNPNKVDINYNSSREDGDLAHISGMTYDAEDDLIYLSVNYYDEIWILDHSTTTDEAATSEGGNFGKGGDLIYRFGNPLAYKNTTAEVFFNRVHYPNLLDTGNLLVFSNRVDLEQSSVVEFELPNPLSLEPGVDNDPEIVWSFTDPDLFSNIVSSAVRMRNGNTLISEGIEGYIWEVTNEGEVVRNMKVEDNILWRAYVFYIDDPAIQALGIE